MDRTYAYPAPSDTDIEGPISDSQYHPPPQYSTDSFIMAERKRLGNPTETQLKLEKG